MNKQIAVHNGPIVQFNSSFTRTEDDIQQESRGISTAIATDDKTLERLRLEGTYGKGNVWDTAELQRDFDVIAFGAPFVGVIRKSDQREGFLEFQHSPRFYFSFSPKEGKS